MSVNQPLVSILAANFNNSRYVIDSLNSIADQSYTNIELIIVDDGSTDNSPDKINEWLKNYSKPFKYIVHKSNKGICATCNELVKNASGKYLSFIATDDMLMPDKIANQVKNMETQHPSVAMLYSDSFLIDAEGNKREGTYMVTLCDVDPEKISSMNITEELTKINFLHWITVLVKREIYADLGMYDETLDFEDYDMSLRISKKYSIAYTSDIQTLYRTHSQSFSGKTKNWNKLLLPLFLKHNDLPIFKKKAEEIILNNYLHKVPGTKAIVLDYYGKTKKKLKYYFFIANNIPPLFMKIYRKIGL